MSDTIEAEFTSKNQLATVQKHLPATLEDVKAVVNRMQIIHALMREAMTVNVDYGVVPGTNSKPTLLKSGAEKICVMFNLCPRYKTEKHWDGPHLTVEATCVINSLSGVALGEASAMCSTRESKYAWRKAQRSCPQCGKPSIIQTKKGRNPGGYWCVPDKGGCNANFAAGSKEIEGQQTGRVANEDLADSYNTVLRIAEKRAYIAAVRLVTGSSALFDEEIPDNTERDAQHDDTPPTKPAQTPQEQKASAEPLKPVEAKPGTPYAGMTLEGKFAYWLSVVSKCKTLDELNKKAEMLEKVDIFDKGTKDFIFAAMDKRADSIKAPKTEGKPNGDSFPDDPYFDAQSGEGLKGEDIPW